jgi:hypothetical protein
MTLIKLTLALFCLGLSHGLISQTKFFEFNYHSGKKSPANLQIFKDSLTKWNKNSDMIIMQIKGYADSVGSERSNYILSKKRALKMDTILKSMGIPAKNVKPVAYGEKFPAYKNNTKTGRSKNRRVQVALFLSPKTVIKKEEIVAIPELIEKPAKICEENDTIILLPGGTEIELKGCSLDGLNLRDIKVEAEEFFTKDKMILNDMFTQTSEGQCLSTGGMLRLKITDRNGNPVILKSGNDITIRIPQLTADTAYDVYGMKQDKNKENLGWDKRTETAKYLKGQKKFEVKIATPTLALNLDFLPSAFNGIKKRKYTLKTKGIKNGKAYVNGETSVLRLSKVKPKKFKFKNCDCIPEKDQFVTAYAKKNGKIYYCHKNINDLKIRWFYNKKYIVRKKDYLILNKEDLKTQLKLDFGVK